MLRILDRYVVREVLLPFFISLLVSLLPFVILVGLLLFFMNQMQGGGSRVMNFGK